MNPPRCAYVIGGHTCRRPAEICFNDNWLCGLHARTVTCQAERLRPAELADRQTDNVARELIKER